MTTATASIEITPELMAEAFWRMSSEDQGEFFHQLAAQIKATSTEFHSQCQWWCLADELTNEGRSVLMDIAAPHYLNILRSKGFPV